MTVIYDSNFYRDYVGFSDPDRDRSHLKDSMGRYRINIFREIGDRAGPALYTMHEVPKDGLPSAYQIYMYSNSEYEAAMKLVGSWAHWLKLLDSNKFMNGNGELWTGLKTWREEKETKDKALAYTLLKSSAADGNVQAQKILFENGGSGKRGRPSKAQIEQAAKEAAKHADDIKSDLGRLKMIAKR